MIWLQSYFVLVIRALQSPSSPKMTRSPQRRGSKAQWGRGRQPHTPHFSPHNPEGRVVGGGHSQKPLQKGEMRLKPQMQKPPGQYHTVSCSTSTQAELIALILGFSQEDLTKNNTYWKAVHSIELKTMGTAWKWRDDLGTTDIHSCNPSAGQPGRKPIHQLPTADTGQDVCAIKQVPGLSSYSANRGFLKHHTPTLQVIPEKLKIIAQVSSTSWDWCLQEIAQVSPAFLNISICILIWGEIMQSHSYTKKHENKFNTIRIIWNLE